MKKNVLLLVILTISISLIFAFSIRSNIIKNGDFKSLGSKTDLKNHSIKNIEGIFDLTDMILNTNADKIVLTGNISSNYNLEIEFYEFKAGDVDFYFKGSNFTYKSKSNKRVHIKSIKGTIPNNIKLRIDNGIGNVKLRSFIGKSVVIDNGTGNLEISNTNCSSLDIDNGNGNIQIQFGKINQFLSIDNGTGNIRIDDEVIEGNINIDNGVGNVDFDGIFSIEVSVDNGTGNVKVLNSKISNIEIDTGIGNIIFNNNYFNEKEFSTGIGKVVEQDNSKMIAY